MVFVFLLAGCGETVDQAEVEEPETAAESVLQEETAEDRAEEGNPEEEGGEPSEAENKYYNAEDQYIDDWEERGVSP